MSTIAASGFLGFVRSDGSVGVRNHLLILSTVALTNRLAELAAEGVSGAIVVAGDFARGLRGDDPALQARVLRALVRHPNVGGALVLCHDVPTSRALEAAFAADGKPVMVQALMAAKGMTDAVARARATACDLANSLAGATRSRVPLSRLVVALECGGSDATSAMAANPSIGRFVDRLIDAGGVAIVSETAEFVGAESVVDARAVNETVSAEILAALARSEAHLSEDGESYRGVNPTQENIEAGLTTLIEKSMGAVAKTGSRPFAGCLTFGSKPPASGLYFMDTPFFSPVSITGMVAASAQVVLFAVGVFNPSGSPLAPTLKVCGNPRTLADWKDSLDVDVSAAVTDGASLDEMADKVELALREVLEGEKTKSEIWSEGQIIIPSTKSLL